MTSIGVVSQPGNTPGLYVQKLLDVVARAGHDIGLFWRESPQLRRLPAGAQLTDMELAYEDYLAFVESVHDRFSIPGLGLESGRRFRATDFGILGYAILSARSLGNALSIAERYQSLWGGSGRITGHLLIEGEQAIWEARSTLPPGRLWRFEIEEALAQFTVARELLANPKDWRILRATMACPAPEYRALYEEVLNCPVHFDQTHSRLYLPRSLLDLPLGTSNELAQEICEDQCSKLLRALEARGGYTEKVRNLILGSPGKMPSLRGVAGTLNLSLRTMRRRLRDEGTTYKEILTEVRMRMARQYLLETPLSIKEISYLLSYSEVANLQRAFRNWYDMTPGEMRRNSNLARSQVRAS